MNEQKKRLFLIKLAYWLGIAADATWAIALIFPGFFSILTGRPDFNPDLEFRLVMGTAASLMTGWTFLLLWAVRKPIERRVVILLTAFPVVTGMFIVALVGVLNGNASNIWILVKTTILIVSMITSYLLANRMSKE
jgi:hypothetical protein